LFDYGRDNVSHQPNVQVAIHVEVDVDLRDMDEEQPRLTTHGDLKQTVSVLSQADMDMIVAELQMKNDFQI
jgi:predicted TIM-barrel fold metal-dependent hydrolase